MKLKLLVIVLVAVPLLLAQDRSAAARLRVLNGQAVSLLARAQQASPEQRAALQSEAATLLAERESALQALIAEDPAESLRLSFPQQVLDRLAGAFPSSAARLESHGQWQGTLEAVVEDGVNFASWRETMRLHSGGRSITVNPAKPVSGDLKCNDTIAASGVLSGNQLAAGEVNLVAEAAAVCSTTGAQNIAVILVNFPSSPLRATLTSDRVRGIFLGNAGGGEQVAVSSDRSISDLWFKNSDGKTWVSNSGGGALKVVGPYTLSQDMAYCTCGANGCSDNSGAVRQAAYAAADADLDYNQYSRVVILLPNNGTCSGIAGVASLGCWSSEAPGDGRTNTSWTWWRDDQADSRGNGVMLGSHEVGHNLTMGHSGSRDHGTEVIGAIGAAGTRSEYGDLFGTMGSWNYGFYNAHHAVTKLAWMSTANYIDVTANGTYSISSYDTQGNAVKAMRIRRGTGTTNAWFWLAYYPSTGLYLAPLGDQIHNAAIIHAQDSATPSGKTDLLDFTPATSSWSDPGLAVGQSWQDPYSDVAISVDSISNGMLNVTVTYSAPPCTNANPTVEFVQTSLEASAISGATYDVRVTSNDSTSCAARAYSLSSNMPDGGGWSTAWTSSSLSLAPGATGSTRLTKTPSSSVPVGSYTVNAVASAPFNSGSTGTSTGSATAGVTVVIPPPAPPAAPSGVSGSVTLSGAGKNKAFQSFTVRWTDNSYNEDRFELRRCVMTGKGRTQTCTYDGWSATAAANAVSYSSTVKPATGTYRFEVRSVNSVGPSGWVASGSVSIP